MANQKITDLSSAPAADDADVLPIVHAGTTVKATVAQVRAGLRLEADLIDLAADVTGHLPLANITSDATNGKILCSSAGSTAWQTWFGKLATTGTGFPTDGLLRFGYGTGDTDSLVFLAIRDGAATDYVLGSVELSTSIFAFGNAAWNASFYGAAMYLYANGPFQILGYSPSVYDYNSAIITDLTVVSKSLLANFTTTLATATATNLTFPMGASDVWIVEIFGDLQCSSTGGVKFNLALPLNAVYDGSFEGIGASLTATARTRVQGTAAAGVTATSGAFSAAATIPGPMRAQFRIKGDGVNAGNVTLQCLSTTATQTSTLFAGFFMTARRATEV